MKNIFLLFLFLITSVAFASSMGLHKSIQPAKTIMLGISPEIDVKSDSQTTYFHFAAGLFDRTDLNLKYGIGTKKPYYGGHLKYHFVQSGFLNFATKAGAHYRGGVILDFFPIFIHKFEKCSVSLSPEFEWQITGNKEFMIDISLGITIPMPRSMALSVSLSLPVKNQSYSLSTGLAIYL